VLVLELDEHEDLRPLIHSLRSRTKDPDHLREKLVRVHQRCLKEARPFDITAENVFVRVTDLVGVRLLHLHTDQIATIDPVLRKILTDAKYEIVEGPIAMVWDAEYRTLFEKFGIEWRENPRMYSSVHYDVQTAREAGLTAEIQVRTLAEELWGETDHAINYPQTADSLACREQILVLARGTSTCTRLVDSIFRTHADAKSRATASPGLAARRARAAGKPRRAASRKGSRIRKGGRAPS
jgi:ppGpp synthetase/RelA/SpoT-type nucleotidyltranferase